MQTIARGFEATLWTVVCVKIEEKAREMGIEYRKYKSNTLLTGVIWYSHGYPPPKPLSLPPIYIGDLGKQIEKVLKIRSKYFQQLLASTARNLLLSPEILPQCAETKLLGVKHAKQEVNSLEAQQARDETVEGQMEAERIFSILKPPPSSTEKHYNKHEQQRLPHRKGHQ